MVRAAFRGLVMPDTEPNSDPRERLADVDRGVRQALERREASRRAVEARRAMSSAAGAPWRIMVDLVVATAVCGGIGYGFDLLTGLSPLGLLVGLFIGFGCGMWLVVRLARSIQVQAGAATPPDGPQNDRS